MSDTIKTIASLKRLRNTLNGNPRYEVAFTDNTVLRTKADSNIAAVIEDPEYRDIPLKVEVNGRGTLSGLTPVPFDQAHREYVIREFGKLATGDLYQVKVSSFVGDGETRWINISHEQMIAIRDIIATKPDTKSECSGCGSEPGYCVCCDHCGKPFGH